MVKKRTALCGDIGFVGYDKHKFISGLIAWFTRGYKESKTKAVHQFLVISNQQIFEAGSRKSRSAIITTLRDRLYRCHKHNAHWIIFRKPGGITNKQRNSIDHKAHILRRGILYGYLEIVLHVADGILRKIKLLPEHKPFFAKLGRVFKNTRICSGIVNYLLFLCGVVPKVWQYFTPDGTYDKMISQGWEVVGMDNNGEVFWNLPKNKENQK